MCVDGFYNMIILLCCCGSKIIVPDGICITAVAMRTHINENKKLSIDLDNAIEKAKQSDFEQLADYCER